MTDHSPVSAIASWFVALKGYVEIVHTYDDDGRLLHDEDEWHANSPFVHDIHGVGKTPADAIADFNAKMVKA